MNQALLIESGTQLLRKLQEAGYEKQYDRFKDGTRTTILTALIGDFIHVAVLKLLNADPALDEVAAVSFFRDSAEKRLEELFDHLTASGNLPGWMEKRMAPIYNTALIDGRIYCCNDWF